MKKVDRWKMEMPTEQEMLPKDKYTVFDRKVKRYRKGIHSKLLLVCGIEGGWVDEIARLSYERARLGKANEYGCGKLLTFCRGPQVDKSQPATQPSWFLSGEQWLCVYYLFLYGLHRLRRSSGIKDIPSSTLACIGYNILYLSVNVNFKYPMFCESRSISMFVG